MKRQSFEEKDKKEILKEEVSKAKQSIEKLCYKIVSSIDPFKLTVDFEGSGYLVKDAQKILERNKIYVELIDDRRILFMFSARTKNAEIKKLVKTLKKITLTLPQGYVAEKKIAVNPKKAVDYLLAVNGEAEYTPIDKAVGKITAENFGTFPPCYPVSVAGEVILKENLEFLEGKDVFGITDGKIKTLRIGEISNER
jgi:arginine/lysine/ornithine decarboxylase